MTAKRFLLVRDQHDGVNQPGVAAEGVRFSCGKVVLSWAQKPNGVATYDSMADVLLVQQQNGVTRIQWLDTADLPVTVSASRSEAIEAARSSVMKLTQGSVVARAEVEARGVDIQFA